MRFKQFFKKFRLLFVFVLAGLFVVPVVTCGSTVVKATTPSYDFVQNNPTGYSFTIDTATFGDYLHDNPMGLDNLTITAQYTWNNASYSSMLIDFDNRYVYFDNDLMYGMSIDNFNNDYVVTYNSTISSTDDYHLNNVLNTLYGGAYHKYVDVYIYPNGGSIEHTQTGNYVNFIYFQYDQVVSNLMPYYYNYIEENYEYTKYNSTLLGFNINSGSNLAMLDSQINNQGVNYSTVVLYCIWQYNAPTTYTLTFSPNGGTGVTPNAITTVGGTIIDLTTISHNLTKTDYEFIGWNTDPNATTIMQSITLNANTIIYAVWRSTVGTYYNITFDSNNASGGNAPASTTAIYNSTFYLYGVNQNTLYRTGYLFLGWNTNSAATTPITSFVVTGDTTLYAIWSNNFITLDNHYYYYQDTLQNGDFTYNITFISDSKFYSKISYINGSLYYDDTQVYSNNHWYKEEYRQIMISNVYLPIDVYNDMLRNGSFVLNHEQTDYNFYDLMISIADVPVRTISGLLSFDLFGMSLLTVFTSIMCLVIIFWVIRKFV